MFPTDQWPDVKTVKEYPTHLVSRMEGPDGWFNPAVFTDIQAPAASQARDGFARLRGALGVGMTVHDFSGAGNSGATATAWGNFLANLRVRRWPRRGRS